MQALRRETKSEMSLSRPILIVFRNNAFLFQQMVSLADALHKNHKIAAYILATRDPDADDIRLWDLGKLTKIEFQEVKKLCEEYANKEA